MLDTVTRDDYTYVTGVVTREGVEAPLGRRTGWVGPHLIGFDDGFDGSLVVRAYYDFERDPAAQAVAGRDGFAVIGYVQFCQITFQGRAIGPEVLGGRIADRQPYLTEDMHFVDFMGPAQIDTEETAIFRTPFYAYNARLTDGSLRTWEGFARHPRTNGSLFLPQPGGSIDQSLCASLCAEIDPGLVTPEDLRRVLADLKPLRRVPATAVEVAGTPFYRIALDSLKNTTGEGESEPPLFELDENAVRAHLVGEYVLLTLVDEDEDFDITLCVAPPGGNPQTIDVYLLDEYDTAALDSGVAGAALQRIYRAVGPVGDAMDIPAGTRRMRGRGGFHASPYRLGPDDESIELRYYAVPVGQRHTNFRRNAYWSLGGFTWAVRLGYDEDTRSLGLVSVEAPVATNAPPNSVIDQYNVAVTDPGNANLIVDTSNFTMAALRREPFAAGTRPRYVFRGNGNA